MSVVRTRPVVITSHWFGEGYARGLRGKPGKLTEQTLVDIVRRAVNIALDDGAIGEDQLRYEVGLLVGTLFAGENTE